MSMDLTANNLVEIIDKALENRYNVVGGDIMEEPFESDGSHACMSADELRRKDFKNNFEVSEFIDSLKEDVDFIEAIKERLQYNF